MTTLTQIAVPFHNTELYIVEHEGQPYTPMKTIVEGMGLDWKSQFVKLKQRFVQGMVEITIPTNSGIQTMLCLLLRKLPAWLYSIHANKVKPELRDTVIMYQNECDDVLWDYWTKGQAINSRNSITPEQQALLHEIVTRRSNGERKTFAEMWSRHNKHFKIAKYNQLLAIHFPEAVHYLETMVLKAKIEKQEVKALPYPQEVIQVAQQINHEYKGGHYHSWFVHVRDDVQLSAMPLLKGYYPINLVEFAKKFDGLLEFVYGNELLTTGRYLASK